MPATVYRGTLLSVSAQGAYIEVPNLAAGHQFGPCQVIGREYEVGQAVAVINVGDIKEDLVVVGPYYNDAYEDWVDGGTLDDPDQINDSGFDYSDAGGDGTTGDNGDVQTAIDAAAAAQTAATNAVDTANGIAATAQSAVDTVAKISLSVDNFGAVGDGVTDNTTAFQAALDYLDSVGGGNLLVSPAVYVMGSTPVVLRSNVTVSAYGATLKRLSGASGCVFVANTPDGSAGYGGGLQHFVWRGGRFLGDFVNNVNLCAFGMHHPQNCLFEDISFEQCQSGVGHVFDLGAGDRITIRRCDFIGQNNNGTSDQAESVNVDGSYYGTLSSGTANTGFSGLMCREIRVEECSFLPVKSGGAAIYPAPNPMGTHFNAEGKQYENIYFVRNYVEDPRANPPVSTSDDSTDDFYAGAVHMPQTRGFYVQDNTFKMTQSYQTRAITCMSKNSGVLASSDPSTTPATRGTFSAPCISEDVYITGNTFIGFHTADSNAALDTVYVRGVTVAGGNVKNVHVSGNSFEDGYNSSASTQKGPILVQNVVGAEVTRNTIESAYYGVAALSVTSLIASNNTLSKCSTFVIYLNTCTNVSVTGNTATSCGGPFQLNSSGNTVVAITGNVFNAPTGVGNAANGIVLTGGSYINCTGNTIVNDTGTTKTRGMAVGGTLTNSLITNNVISGYTTAISGTPGANVTTTGNLS